MPAGTFAMSPVSAGAHGMPSGDVKPDPLQPSGSIPAQKKPEATA
jgi:hypothetical protein